jgi:hypothetical protein
MEVNNPNEQDRQASHACNQNDGPPRGPSLTSRGLSLAVRVLKRRGPGHRGPRLGVAGLHAIIAGRIDRDQRVAHQAFDLVSPEAIWEATGSAAFRAGVLSWHENLAIKEEGSKFHGRAAMCGSVPVTNAPFLGLERVAVRTRFWQSSRRANSPAGNGAGPFSLCALGATFRTPWVHAPAIS